MLQAQSEKEELMVNQIAHLIASHLEADSSDAIFQNIENIMNDADILRLEIANSHGIVLREINLWSKKNVYNKNDIHKLSKYYFVNDELSLDIYFEFDTSQLNESVSKSKFEVGAISLSIFLICVSIIFVSRIILTRSVKSISESAKKISSGNLSERIESTGKNTIGEIANAINQLAEDLQKANSQIDKLNKELKFQFKDKIGELNYEINKKRQAETLLKQSEEQFRLLFELAPIGMVISSTYGKILKANKAYCTTLGYDENEILERKIKDLTHPDDRAMDGKHHEKLIEYMRENAYYEKRMLRKDGKIIYVIVDAVVVKNKEGKANHIIEQVIDITERKRVEKELIYAKEKAEESDRLKSAFLAQMSHEIRTPLNVILAAMNLINDEMGDSDEDNKLLMESVSSAGKRLQRTIDLILNISAVQSGSYELEYRHIDLNRELKALVEEFEPLTREKNLEVLYVSKTLRSKIVADHYSVTQIFHNLIGNAVKYTPKGSIQIELESCNEDKLLVQIKDTGIGISKEYLANLFTPFSQEDIGQKREYDGNGLGLALVKKYVDINDAEILVESEKDKGSTFTVIFNRQPLDSKEQKNYSSVKSDNLKEFV
jgi:PAS domain S-box-containing protein